MSSIRRFFFKYRYLLPQSSYFIHTILYNYHQKASIQWVPQSSFVMKRWEGNVVRGIEGEEMGWLGWWVIGRIGLLIRVLCSKFGFVGLGRELSSGYLIFTQLNRLTSYSSNVEISPSTKLHSQGSVFPLSLFVSKMFFISFLLTLILVKGFPHEANEKKSDRQLSSARLLRRREHANTVSRWEWWQPAPSEPREWMSELNQRTENSSEGRRTKFDCS